MKTLNEKRTTAIEYLRQRGIYLLDGKFTPTTSAATDVAATIARYRREEMKQPFPAVIRKRRA